MNGRATLELLSKGKGTAAGATDEEWNGLGWVDALVVPVRT
jgi:hypothetical protein